MGVELATAFSKLSLVEVSISTYDYTNNYRLIDSQYRPLERGAHGRFRIDSPERACVMSHGRQPVEGVFMGSKARNGRHISNNECLGNSLFRPCRAVI